jgi:transposase
METSAPPIGTTSSHLAAIKRGLKHGLKSLVRAVILMLDETIITETPPLYSCYGRIGQQVRIPIIGTRSILHGAINVNSGDVLLLITMEWDQDTHQAFLRMLRSHWRGWHVVLFEDRGTPHKAEGSLELARDIGIQIRFLPRATPELNAMDQFWRQVKTHALANRATCSIDQSADYACSYILATPPSERLRQAGVLSDRFWLNY